ncbi:MAG: hypothetical protein QW706_08455 [Candidatus Nezhaarchaeales archaeon]
MELRVNGFANIINASYNLLTDRASVVVTNKSATGKTTIARILYAFLTGEARTDLVAKDSDAGVAELLFRNKVYRLYLSKSGEKRVERVIDGDYAQYLVLTEVGPMYAFYYQPDKFDLSTIVDKVVERPDTKDIEEEMRRIEQTIGSSPKIVREYEELIPKYESELAEVERRLAEVDKMIERAARSEKVEVILKKNKLEDELRRIEDQIKRYEEEIARISTELQGVNYEELRRRRKSLGDDVERLEKAKLAYSGVVENLKTLRDALRKLVGFADVLADLNVYLFGAPVDPQTLESFASDCDVAIEEVTAKASEVDAKLAEVRRELSNVDNAIRRFNEKFNRREALQFEIQKLVEKKRNLEYEKVRVDREVSKLVKELGKSEAELVKEYVSQEDVQKLLTERSKLMDRRQELATTIASLRSMVENFRKEQETAEALRKRYEALRRAKEEREVEYQRKRKQFAESFREHMVEAFKTLGENGVQIKHFNPQTLRFERSGQTYSKSERLLITVCYITSLAKTLVEMGYDVPFVAIDVLSPIDGSFEKALIELVRSVPTKAIVLMTKNENSVYSLQ